MLDQLFQNQIINQDAVYFDYVIFERDPWPAKSNEQYFGGRTDGGAPGSLTSSWKLKYRSAEKKWTDWNYPYVAGTFCNNITLATNQNNYYATGFVTNDDIEFNTIAY